MPRKKNRKKRKNSKAQKNAEKFDQIAEEQKIESKEAHKPSELAQTLTQKQTAKINKDELKLVETQDSILGNLEDIAPVKKAKEKLSASDGGGAEDNVAVPRKSEIEELEDLGKVKQFFERRSSQSKSIRGSKVVGRVSQNPIPAPIQEDKEIIVAKMKLDRQRTLNRVELEKTPTYVEPKQVPDSPEVHAVMTKETSLDDLGIAAATPVTKNDFESLDTIDDILQSSETPQPAVGVLSQTKTDPVPNPPDDSEPIMKEKIENNVSEHNWARAQEMFMKADKTADGSLSKTELRNYLQNNPTEHEAFLGPHENWQNLFAYIDKNHDDRFSLEEFTSAVEVLIKTERDQNSTDDCEPVMENKIEKNVQEHHMVQAQEMFMKADKTEDGYLSKTELRNYLQNNPKAHEAFLGPHENWQNLFAHIDKNHDDRFSLEEFTSAVEILIKTERDQDSTIDEPPEIVDEDSDVMEFDEPDEQSPLTPLEAYEIIEPETPAEIVEEEVFEEFGEDFEAPDDTPVPVVVKEEAEKQEPIEVIEEEEEDFMEFGEDFEVPDEPVIVEKDAEKEEAKEEVPQEKEDPPVEPEEAPTQEIEQEASEPISKEIEDTQPVRKISATSLPAVIPEVSQPEEVEMEKTTSISPVLSSETNLDDLEDEERPVMEEINLSQDEPAPKTKELERRVSFKEDQDGEVVKDLLESPKVDAKITTPPQESKKEEDPLDAHGAASKLLRTMFASGEYCV